MKVRLKKQQHNNDVAPLMPAAVQTKLLPDVRSMDSPFSNPETAQRISQEEQGKNKGFNFADVPIFAAASEVAASPRQGNLTVQAKLEPVQRQEGEDEEPMQGKLEPVQREEGEDEEPMQGKLEPVQREEGEDEEPMQGKLEPVQREEGEDEEPMQGKLEPVQREEGEDEEPMQGKLEPVQRTEGEDEEPMQGKLEPVQREEGEDEEPMQGKLEPVQREEGEEEEPMQGKLEPVQRTEGENEEPMQGKRETDPKQPVQAKINLAPSGGGKPMPEAVQQKMEGAFGADFSGVRIHEGPQAKAINAVAYTQGSDIHFQPGKYQPETQSGQELLGHELTHVVQQKAGRVTVPQGKGAPINADPGLESEADVLGAKAARGESVEVAGTPTQRKAIHRSINARAFPTKNDIFLKQGSFNTRTQHGEEVLAYEKKPLVQQNKTTIQRKTKNINIGKIEPFVTTKSMVSDLLTGDTKTEIIRDTIQEYNAIDQDDTNYAYQKKKLKKIIEKGQDWIDERNNPSMMQKIKSSFKSNQTRDPMKQKAIEEIQEDAAQELMAVRNQEVQAKAKTKAEASKIKQYGTELWGGVEGAKDEGMNIVTTGGVTKASINIYQTDLKTLFEGGKKVAEEPEVVKSGIEAIISVGKSIFDFLSKCGILDVGTIIWSFYKLKKAYDDKLALEDAKYEVQVRGRKNESQEGDRDLLAALSHGYGKVERRVYSNLYNVITSVIGFSSRLVTILSGFTASAFTAVIELGKTALGVITTAYRKVKGMIKLITGKRGANRKLSAERIFDAAFRNDKAALKLLVDFEIQSNIQTVEEMYKFITSPQGVVEHEEIKQKVTEKLKSQA